MPANSVLYTPSHKVPGFAVIFLNGPAPVGLRTSPLPVALWVPSQGDAGNIMAAFPQGTAESSRFSCPYFKVRLTSYSPHVCVNYFLGLPDI